MPNYFKENEQSRQIRWVVIIISMIVILPTTCLLWFMNHTIQNERIIVRQKLTDIYTQQILKLCDYYDQQLNKSVRQLRESLTQEPPKKWINHIILNPNYNGGIEAILSFDHNNQVITPNPISNSYTVGNSHPEFIQAQSFEYGQHYQKAIHSYLLSIQGPESTNETICLSVIGHARCLIKLNQAKKAMDTIRDFIHSFNTTNMSTQTAFYFIQAHLYLIEIGQKHNITSKHKGYSHIVPRYIEYILSIIASSNKSFNFTNNQKLFILKKLNTLSQGRKVEILDNIFISVEAIINTHTNMAQIANQYEPTLSNIIDKLPGNSIKQINNQVVLVLEEKSIKHCAFIKLNTLLQDTENYAKTLGLTHKHFDLSILDETKSPVFGINSHLTPLQKTPFLRVSFSDHSPETYFKGWQIELNLIDSTLFEKTAEKQILIYIWMATLMIIVLAILSYLVIRSITKQIKLNKLKNDFVATVSHELKTPIASIRLLIDTLTEGRISDETQKTEYLEMVSKENKRLSQLIDNFLTFSRMERNKQTFELIPTDPNEIIQEALQATQAQFKNHTCQIKVNIPDQYPLILADHQALIRVLINLLDNACKYSGENKKIQLEIRPNGKYLQFIVIDQGMGISKRNQKKIFDRFYQVDQTLSRHSSGAGLGLSIVQYIVQAHKGKIEVESTPDQGSRFIVSIPIDKRKII